MTPREPAVRVCVRADRILGQPVSAADLLFRGRVADNTPFELPPRRENWLGRTALIWNGRSEWNGCLGAAGIR